MTEKELKSWIFAWTKDVNGTPLDSEINDLIYMVDAHLAPKMKRVDLGLKREMRNPVKQGGKSNDWYQNGYDVGYNAAIDDIKSKYGDLWVEVK